MSLSPGTPRNKIKEQEHNYLQSLSKNELIALVERYAPEQFFATIKNLSADKDTIQDTFRKVKRNIRQLFDDDDLLCEIYDFSDAINKQIKKLSGLEKPLQKEIEDLLFYIMDAVNEAFDEGYLYDSYGDESYTPSPAFDAFFARYVSILEGEDRISFLSKLDSRLQKMSYTTFEEWVFIAVSVFDKHDLPALKASLIKTYKDISIELTSQYYDLVYDLLSLEEKETILNFLAGNNSKRIIELAELYIEDNRPNQAIERLKRYLQNKSPHWGDEPVYSLYLDLLQKGEADLSELARNALLACPTNSMLKKLVSMLPEQSEEYERLLEKKNPLDYLRYLENGNRLQDALSLIKKSQFIPHSQQYDFFKKHKLFCPEEAAAYFAKVIRGNLQETGDRHYQAIAEAIKLLKEVDPKEALRYLLYIRTNYKRRRNLMVLLEKISV